ncbi:MAG: hypothetical protein IJ194_04930, partial [Bacilli bacterium]|nr:hypothetical protein [Bacilli bacterium]
GLGFASPFFPRLGHPSKVGFGYVGFLYKATHRGLSPQACDVPVTQKAAHPWTAIIDQLSFNCLFRL